MMPRIFIVSVLVFSFTAASAKKIPGQIIDRGGRSTDVIFNIPFRLLASQPNFERLQYRIVYYDKAGTRLVLRPEDAEEIRFEHRGVEVRMISRANTIGGGSLFSDNSHIFLRIFIDGPLKLFRYYYTQTSPGMYNPTSGVSAGMNTYGAENFVLQKEGAPLMQPRGLTFRKDMAEYLSDCPEVVQKIQGRELRRAELEIIVMEYNKKCGN